MRRYAASSVFLLSLTLVVVISGLATWHFFSEMNSNYVLIASGFEPQKFVFNNYGYFTAKKGLIFSLSFFIASSSFMIMVLLPGEEGKVVPAQRLEPVRKPRKEEARAESISAEVQAPKQGKEQAVSSVTPMAPAVTKGKDASAPRKEVSLAVEEEDIEFDEDSLEVTEGEDDVVYGTEPITTAAIMDFVHKFPDSALKFLYRKQLDGKPLTPDEEEIYAMWEARDMTRGKVKTYILSLMEWKDMPKEPLYEIWKKMRDLIFDSFS